MSHFCGIVFIEANDEADALSKLPGILDPYDENLRVDTYIYQTKDELLDSLTSEIKGKRKFIQEHASSEDSWDVATVVDMHNTLLTYNNFETDQDYINYAKNSGYDLDEDLNALSNYNPDSKWDWYEVGGRWDGDVLHADGYDTNTATKGDLIRIDTPYCFVDLKGQWNEKGSMGWWGVSYNEKDDWETVFRKYLETVPDNTWLVLVDFHI